MTPLTLFGIFVSASREQLIFVPHLLFLASTVPETRRGSQNSKNRSCDLFTTPFVLILLFFVSAPRCLYTRAKFEVSSFTFPRYGGVTKFKQ